MKSVIPINEGSRKPCPVHGTSRTTRSKIQRKRRTDQCKRKREVRVMMKTEATSRPGNGHVGTSTRGRNGDRHRVKPEGGEWNRRRKEM